MSPRTKHTFRLREGDVEALKSHFPVKGANYVIARLVSDFVDKLARPVSDEQVEELVNIELKKQKEIEEE